MLTCCCQLAGTDACRTCRNNKLEIGKAEPLNPYQHYIPSTYFQPLGDIKFLHSVTVQELLDELNKRTSVFVNKSFSDEKEDIYTIKIVK